MVMGCLRMAASRKHRSIAFPALGTGVLEYPEGDVAKAMIEAMVEYAENNPHTPITDVKIILYSGNKLIQKVSCLF